MVQKQASEFDKPLDEWIEEEVEVPTFKPKVNEKENRVEFERTTQKVRQKTFYSEGHTSVVVCTEHTYIPVNKGRYLFRCSRCQWNRIAPPITFTYDQETGVLARRDTGERI